MRLFAFLGLLFAASLAQAGPASSGLALLNQWRSAEGVPVLEEDMRLAQAAQGHALYLSVVAHQDEGHFERPGEATFTGATPLDRCHGVGVQEGCAEVLVRGAASVEDALMMFMLGPYHRSLVLDPRASRLGAGVIGLPDASNRQVWVVDLAPDFSRKSADLVVWPTDETGMAVVPGMLHGQETPDPIPVDIDRSGYILSVQSIEPVQVTSWVMHLAGSSTPVAARIRQLAADRPEVQLLVPESPLQPGQKYEVDWQGMVGSKPVSRHWSFHTLDHLIVRGLPEGKLKAGQSIDLDVRSLSGAFYYSLNCFDEPASATHATLHAVFSGKLVYGPECFIRLWDPIYTKARVDFIVK